MSVRIGFKGIVPFLPNAGIVVVKVEPNDWERLEKAATIIRTILAVAGCRFEFVCERRD